LETFKELESFCKQQSKEEGLRWRRRRRQRRFWIQRSEGQNKVKKAKQN